MQIILILFLAVVAVLLVLLLLKPDLSGDKSLVLMQGQIEALRKQLNDSLQANSQVLTQQLNSVIGLVNNQLSDINRQLMDSQKTLGERLDNASKIVGDVQKGLGALSQATERVFEVGKDISSLQEILRAPKLRGSLGELFLEDLLTQILAKELFTLQYQFKNGETVDAIIRLGGRFVCVDSKFPLENFIKFISESQPNEEKKNYRKKFVADVKKHIDTMAEKYIVPDEGSFDFALMYIPAENVYYETIIKNELSDEFTISTYAMGKRVIPVSPNSFYSYLQVIILGFKGMYVEKNAKLILESLARLKNDFEKFKTEFEVLGRHLSSAKSKYEDTDKKLARFEEKLNMQGDKLIEAKPKKEISSQ